MEYYREQCRRRARLSDGPGVKRLDAWQTHCEDEHGATVNDYRRRVLEWHRANHPDCVATRPGAGAVIARAARWIWHSLLSGGATRWR